MRNFPELVFHVESADRSVGIMSEDFSAWESKGTNWCRLADIQPPKYEWYDNETGDETERPSNAHIVESFLITCANMYYDIQG